MAPDFGYAARFWRDDVEALREYLGQMPKLSDMLLERMGEALEEATFDHNNAEEMRLAYKEALQVALERILERKLPYFAITYPQSLWKCPTCQEETKGAYYEISNPITHARGMFRVRLMHELLAHGRMGYCEPIVNMSDTLMGEDDHNWDFKKLTKILDGLPVPEPVMAEIRSGLEAKV